MFRRTLKIFAANAARFLKWCIKGLINGIFPRLSVSIWLNIHRMLLFIFNVKYCWFSKTVPLNWTRTCYYHPGTTNTKTNKMIHINFGELPKVKVIHLISVVMQTFKILVIFKFYFCIFSFSIFLQNQFFASPKCFEWQLYKQLHKTLRKALWWGLVSGNIRSWMFTTFVCCF